MELLAPANTKTFFECINNGANAIYFGLSEFSARALADNINLDNLDYYVSYAHLFDVKVYCAVNTLVKNSEINKFINLIVSAYNKGVDAFILQDVFLGKYIKQLYPDIELHLSTQAGVNNIYGAKLAKEFGFSRVILARETSMEEIKEIASFIETEIFVHGALCSSFSGHCYYSSYIGGNSGNRGRCKQPCRQPFNYFGNEKINFGKYNLSLSDLMLCDYIKDIKDLGVKSLKIEGRMRSEEYTSCAVKLYRNAIDGNPYFKEKADLKCIYNRGDYTTGYFKKDSNIISDKIQSHKGDFFSKILKVGKDILACEKIAKEGDCFKIIRNGYEIGNCTFKNNKFYYKGQVKVGDSLYLTKSLYLIQKYVGKKKLKNIKLKIEVLPTKIKVEYNNQTFTSQDIVQESKNLSTTAQEIISNFLKVDSFPFNVEIDIKYTENKFIPKSLLNAFRREVFSKIFNIKQDIKNIKIIDNISDFKIVYDNCKIVITENLNAKIFADKIVLYPNDYKDLSSIVSVKNFNEKNNIYLFIPAFLNNKDIQLILPYLSKFSGIYANGLSGLFLAKEYNLSLIVGLGLNIFNSISYNIAKEYFKECDIIVSKEITEKEYFGGIRFIFGKLSLMEFIYCPFKYNCENCNKKRYYKGADSYESFTLRRVSLSSCRFELLTDKIMCINSNFSSGLISFVGLSDKEIDDYSNNCLSFKKIIQKDIL